MKTRRVSKIGMAVIYAVLIAWAVISLIPLYWVFTTSLQQPGEVDVMPPKLIPTVISRYLPLRLSGEAEEAAALVDGALESYRLLFRKTNMGRWFLNSLMISLCATTGILLLDSMAAFSFAKKEFPGGISSSGSWWEP